MSHILYGVLKWYRREYILKGVKWIDSGMLKLLLPVYADYIILFASDKKKFTNKSKYSWKVL